MYLYYSYLYRNLTQYSYIHIHSKNRRKKNRFVQSARLDYTRNKIFTISNKNSSTFNLPIFAAKDSENYPVKESLSSRSNAKRKALPPITEQARKAPNLEKDCKLFSNSIYYHLYNSKASLSTLPHNSIATL